MCVLGGVVLGVGGLASGVEMWASGGNLPLHLMVKTRINSLAINNNLNNNAGVLKQA